MRRIETHLLAGPAGHLEALLEEPEEGSPVEAALVCHPHPLYGGTLHNKVVHRLARGLRRSGCVVLRFNFRGVNLSQGVHDEGAGEIEDARAALRFLRSRYPQLPYTLAGFSFGSRVALRLAYTLWAPLPGRVIAAGLPTTYRDWGFLNDMVVPRIFIQSTNDEHGPRAELEKLVAVLPGPKQVHWIEARDHFFAGNLDGFEAAVAGLGSLAHRAGDLP
jgi:uncharacterized protein